MKGDMNVYGRVFVSNAGLGLIYGDLNSSTAIGAIPDNSTNLTSVYPNPFSEYLTLSKTNESFTYRVISIIGNLVESGKGTDTVNAGQKLNNGLYFLEINSGNQKNKEVYRIVKQGKQ